MELWKARFCYITATQRGCRTLTHPHSSKIYFTHHLQHRMYENMFSFTKLGPVKFRVWNVSFSKWKKVTSSCSGGKPVIRCFKSSPSAPFYLFIFLNLKGNFYIPVLIHLRSCKKSSVDLKYTIFFLARKKYFLLQTKESCRQVLDQLIRCVCVSQRQRDTHTAVALLARTSHAVSIAILHVFNPGKSWVSLKASISQTERQRDT